jgi:hypothetical protein
VATAVKFLPAHASLLREPALPHFLLSRFFPENRSFQIALFLQKMLSGSQDIADDEAQKAETGPVFNKT